MPEGIVHDDNGNRLGKSGTTTYEYDPEGRLTEANNLVRYKYDYSGKRVLRIDNTNPTNPEGSRYFTPEVETRNMPDQYWGRMTKHYFFGGVRIASRDVGWSVPPVQYAFADSVPPVTIVAAAGGWGYEVRLRPDVQQGLPTLAFVGFVALVLLPDRRRRKVVGIRLRRGPTLLVVGLWTVGTFPGPFFLMPTQPAWAGGGGGSAPPKPAEVLRHFHYDHLGSLQVMTTAGGSAAQYIRYKPFGEERGRYNAALQAPNPNDPLGLSKYTFTGYEQDGRTGLQYANARWYDPDLGQFATHDPKRQFDSPYNYGAWDPTNLTDPSGEFVEGIALAIVAIFAVAAGIDAGIQTGDPMEGFKAFGINLGIGLLGAGVGSVVGPVVSKVPATLRLAATLSLGSYGVVSSVRNGAYVSAAVTFGNMLYSAYGIANGTGGGGQQRGLAQGGRGGEGLSGQSTVGSAAGRSGFWDVAGKIWNLPNTALGLAYGFLGGVIDRTLWLATFGYVDLGFSMSTGNNAIQFQNHPLQKISGGGAITLGNTISYGGLPTDAAPTSVAFTTVSVGQHEVQHTFQGQVLGPLYLPANVLGGAASILGTPFTGLGPGGSPWHGPLNFMERGPLSVPPRRWP